MNKEYFAVWFDGDSFETTGGYLSIDDLKKSINWFEEPHAQGHIVIFHSDGSKFYPVEEAWAPTEAKLNWRKYQRAARRQSSDQRNQR